MAIVFDKQDTFNNLFDLLKKKPDGVQDASIVMTEGHFDKLMAFPTFRMLFDQQLHAGLLYRGHKGTFYGCGVYVAKHDDMQDPTRPAFFTYKTHDFDTTDVVYLIEGNPAKTQPLV